MTSFVPGAVSTATGTLKLKGPAGRVSTGVPFTETDTDATPMSSVTLSEKLIAAPGTMETGGGTVNATMGGALSMFNAMVVLAVLPALSATLPEIVRAPPSSVTTV